MTVDNGAGVAVRADINLALKALASQSSGASAPSPTFPAQMWADTGTGRLKQRDAANSIWVDKGPLDGAMAPLDSPVFTGLPQGQFPCVVGSMRNAKMAIATASATGTFTADEIIVKSALGGMAYRIASFSKVINLATTGVGGMDSGAAPASGFVSIYAIYNPTTAISALLACNQATSSGNVYAGANMPAGYTASCLVSAWGTTAASLLAIGLQIERQINIALTTINSSTANQANTSISMAAIVPTAAKEIGGLMQAGSTAASYTTIALSGTVGAVGSRSVGGQIVAGAAVLGSFSGLSLGTPAICFYTANASTGSLSSTAYLTSYTI